MCARVPREQVFIRYITGSLYLVGISFPFIKMEFTLNAYMCGYTIQATASEPFKLEPNKQNGERRKALKIQITRHNFRNVDVHIQVDCITLVLVNKSSLKYTMRNKLSYTHTQIFEGKGVNKRNRLNSIFQRRCGLKWFNNHFELLCCKVFFFLLIQL